MEYNILSSKEFKRSLRDILWTLSSASPQKRVIDFLNLLQKRIEGLCVFPEEGFVPKNNHIARLGFRALVIDRYILFYKVNKESKLILLYYIVASRREYESLIY